MQEGHGRRHVQNKSVSKLIYEIIIDLSQNIGSVHNIRYS